MLFESRLPWQTLATFCRSLGTMLHSGVNILKAFQVAGGKSLNPSLRAASKRVIDELRKGSPVSVALEEQAPVFPELMIDLVRVAEQTGSLPEVLTSLADHYDNLVRLRRTFLGAIAWPMFQFVAAIFIVAGLIAILGWITEGQGGKPVDVLGIGLAGTSGALIWLGGWFGAAIALVVVYRLLATGLRGRAMVHSLLLGVPAVGGCLRSFAVARFSWAFALTQQAGMSIEPSLETSLKATSNGAFIGATPQVLDMVREGDDLTIALHATGLFPQDYLELVRVGEATGTVPEQLERLSPQLEDQARRSLAGMTSALAWVIWSLVAVLIVFIIFRIMTNYISILNEAAKPI